MKELATETATSVVKELGPTLSSHLRHKENYPFRVAGAASKVGEMGDMSIFLDLISYTKE